MENRRTEKLFLRCFKRLQFFRYNTGQQMLSKKTPYGEDMEIQTEYKWTTGCGFIWWLVFLMIFFSFASFKYDRLSTIKSKSSYQSMEPLPYIPIVVNSTGLTPKFKIKFDITNVVGADY